MDIKNKNDWCFRFFNSQDYLDIYQDMTGPARTANELDFCERVLFWSMGEKILDAPCGAGRHTLALAKQGHHVTGLDFSSYLLNQAHQNISSISSEDQRPQFVRGLLQNLPLANDSFHHIICLFSSFGYGETEEENLQILKEFHRILQPKGKVLIDVMNRYFIIPRLNAVYESIQSGLRVREERTITDNKRRLHNCITVRDKAGNKRQYYYRPWLFNGWELSWLAARAGLTVEKVYGNFYGDEYEESSERAMLVAVKGA